VTLPQRARDRHSSLFITTTVLHYALCIAGAPVATDQESSTCLTILRSKKEQKHYR